MADTKLVAFITYTKDAVQYVTTPQHETQFLNWLATVDKTSNYTRETNNQVGVRCSPSIVHAKAEKSATILKLVTDTTQ